MLHWLDVDPGPWEVDRLMADPMLVRRLAVDLRNLSNKTLELRGAVEDYRHDMVRCADDGAFADDELRALQRQIQNLWSAMDRAEVELRKASRKLSPLLWLE
jgi:hypothetical protein